MAGRQAARNGYSFGGAIGRRLSSSRSSIPAVEVGCRDICIVQDFLRISRGHNCCPAKRRTMIVAGLGWKDIFCNNPSLLTVQLERSSRQVCIFHATQNDTKAHNMKIGAYCITHDKLLSTERLRFGRLISPRGAFQLSLWP